MTDFPLIASLKQSIKNENLAAIITTNGFITYKKIFQLIDERKSALLSFNIKKGDLVGLSISKSNFELLITQLAIANIGATILPIPIPRGKDGRKAIAEKFFPKVIIAENIDLSIPNFKTISLQSLRDCKPETVSTNYQIEIPNPLLVTLSSGTTGQIKGIVVTHEDMLFRINHLPMNFNQFTRAVPFDINYALGFASAMKVLKGGGSIIFPTSEINKQNKKDSRLSQFNIMAINYAEFSPAQLGGLIDSCVNNFGKIINTDLTLRIVGDFFSEKLLQICLERVSKKIYYSYGLTEMGAITFTLPTNPKDLATGGSLVADITVECVDLNDKPVLKDEIGKIRIKYSEMPNEYLMDPELTKTKFKNGWYYTGDNGILTQDNKLIIKGRDDDVINIGGTLTNLNAIKDTILKVEGVMDVYVFTKNNLNDVTELYLAIIAKENANIIQLKKMCSVSVKPSPKNIFIVEEFPLNSNGKIDRQNLEKKLMH